MQRGSELIPVPGNLHMDPAMAELKKDYYKFYDLLEIPYDSSFMEIRKAYIILKNIYSNESIASIPLKDEISAEQNNEILDQIEDAYKQLLSLHEKKDNVEKKENTEKETKEKKIANTGNSDDDIEEFTGPILRRIRKQQNIELHDIALATKIQIQYFRDIEDENFKTLPPVVYIKGFLISYSEYLSLDSKQVTKDYMNRYEKWENKPEKINFRLPFRKKKK